MNEARSSYEFTLLLERATLSPNEHFPAGGSQYRPPYDSVQRDYRHLQLPLLCTPRREGRVGTG